MDTYNAFASVYDQLMGDIPYEEWFSFVCSLLHEDGIADGLVLELGCGTGTLTELFSSAGYDMIGIDNSVEMLDEALKKRNDSGSSILYLNQDMREFELYGTVRAVISLCDTMNYLADTDELTEVLKLVNNYLDPGGLFIFDLKTDAFFREDAGDQSFSDAGEDVSFIWDNTYYTDERVNEYALTLFIKDHGNCYHRFDEYHEQYAFSVEEIRQCAETAGMEFVKAVDGNGNPVDSHTKRIYILLREKGKKYE